MLRRPYSAGSFAGAHCEGLYRALTSPWSMGIITLGPPALEFNCPETESMASRISSASRRRRLKRQSRRLSGSFSIASAFAAALAGAADDCRYVLLLRI